MMGKKINKRQFVGSLTGCVLFIVATCYVFFTFDYDFGSTNDRRKEEVVANAILFFAAVGVPGLVYALWAGFGLRARAEQDEKHEGVTALRRVLRVGIVAGLLFALWALWIEPSSLRVSEHQLSVATWPRTCDGFRIAVLAD